MELIAFILNGVGLLVAIFGFLWLLRGAMDINAGWALGCAVPVVNVFVIPLFAGAYPNKGRLPAIITGIGCVFWLSTVFAQDAYDLTPRGPLEGTWKAAGYGTLYTVDGMEISDGKAKITGHLKRISKGVYEVDGLGPFRYAEYDEEEDIIMLSGRTTPANGGAEIKMYLSRHVVPKPTEQPQGTATVTSTVARNDPPPISDRNAIKSTFQSIEDVYAAFRTAMLEGDGDTAARLADDTMLLKFRWLLIAALEGFDGDPEKINAYMRLNLAVVRHMVPADDLQQMDERALFKYMVDNYLLQLSHLRNYEEPSAIDVDGSEAIAAFGSQIRLAFHRYADGWRVGRSNISAVYSEHLTASAASAGVSLEQFIMSSVERVYGGDVTSEIWTPLAERPMAMVSSRN